MNDSKIKLKNKTLAIMLLLVMVTLMVVSSLIFVNNKTSAEEIAPYAFVDGDGKSYGSAYCITPWDDEFDVKKEYDLGNGIHRYFILNVNPKDIGAGLFDEVTITYEYYYKDSQGKKVLIPLEIFTAGITYIKQNGTVIRDFEQKDNLSHSTFTKTSSAYTINHVRVEVMIAADGAIIDDIYFDFYGEKDKK